MISRILHLILLSILFISITSCKSTSFENTYKDNSPITVKGKLTKIGNHPFETYAINIKKYNVNIPIIFKLKSIEHNASSKYGKSIKISGKLKINKRKTADLKKDVIAYLIIVDKLH